MSARDDRVELLPGTLDMLILKSLVSGPRHGYGVARWIQATSREVLAVEEGSLYPALHRMTRRGWIDAQWGKSESNRRAKFYRLTRNGRARLRREIQSWEAVAGAITLVLMSEPAGGDVMIRRWLLAVAQYLRTPPSLTGRELDDSIRDELEFHLVESAREQLEQGTTPEDAGRAARGAFGDTSRVARQCSRESLWDQLVCHRVHLVLTAALLGIVATLVTLHLMKPADVPAIASPTPAVSHTGDIVGQIVDDAGAPIGQAHVLAVVKTWPDNGYRQQAHMATTSPDGRFAIADVYPVGETFEVQIAAIAQQRVMQSQYIRSDGEVLESIEFRLAATGQMTMRVEGENGVAVEGAEVFPHRRQDGAGGDHLVYFQSADPIIRRTAADGTVAMPYFLPGDRVTVYVRLPNGQWRTEEVVVPEDANTIQLQLTDEALSNPTDS